MEKVWQTSAVTHVAENLTAQDVFNLTVTDFRAAKKAVAVLTRAGVSFNVAAAIVLEAAFNRRQRS